jgi:glutathione S-transferase
MILIGQYDSPFVRRVGIALRLYGLAFEHRPLSAFGDAERIVSLNPLGRVPALVLNGGETLIESGAILDHLDELVGQDRALIARSGPDRRHALKICALATGMADKAVSLLYERRLRQEPSAQWILRCGSQIDRTLEALETDRSHRTTRYWFGEELNHADIAVTCAIRFADEAHPGAFDPARFAALAAHVARCEALAAFREIAQPLTPPPAA